MIVISAVIVKAQRLPTRLGFWTVWPLIRIIPSFNRKGCSAQVRRRWLRWRTLQQRLRPELFTIVWTRHYKAQKGTVPESELLLSQSSDYLGFAQLFDNIMKNNSTTPRQLSACSRAGRSLLTMAVTLAFASLGASSTFAQSHGGGEANLILPNLSDVTFFGGINGHNLLLAGIVVCMLGLLFGLAMYMNLRNLPVHSSMREISELIYATCKTYLVTQGKFILILEIFIGIVIVLYFGVLSGMEPFRVAIILAFSLVGIAGSYGVAWFGIRVNTFANSRTAFASLEGKPFPLYAIPLRAGMSIGMMLISVELLIMLCILLFIPGDYAGPCFIGFAIGESLGAAALRIAGGIFTKIADIGADLMKIVFKIKEDDARNPGVIADCTGDNAGDSVGPSADGFETYGVTGVALITFILLAVPNTAVQVQLLVWIFVMRIMMIVASAASYFINDAIAKARYGTADKMNFEAPLTSLVWITSAVLRGDYLHRFRTHDSHAGR